MAETITLEMDIRTAKVLKAILGNCETGERSVEKMFDALDGPLPKCGSDYAEELGIEVEEFSVNLVNPGVGPYAKATRNTR